ncbi:nucleoside hydrolase [Enterococcus larvae]|uniref:nucleoside hydrolase n=1 Tax=Enterococcus larvae TaxID=2794352 RepID=UPI003F312870
MKMILDLDTGIDDALAVAYALGHEEIELLGITTSFGNVTVDKAVKNSIDILDLFGQNDIPVFKGSDFPWGMDSYAPSENIQHIHGENGLGNIDLGVSSRRESSISAVDFMTQAAHEYGNLLTVVTTGPLTNLAEAIKKDRTAIEKIGKIVVMGGALTVPGNVTSFAEANIFNDAHAAKFVLESDIPLVIVGLDITLKMMLTGKDIQTWQSLSTKAAQAVTAFTTYYYQNEYDHSEFGGALHDPLAVEVAVNPEIVTDYLPINLTVETKGASTGRTIAALPRLNDTEKSAQIGLDVKGQDFVQRFTETVYRLLEAAK